MMGITCGLNGQGFVERDVKRIVPGVGEIDCLECEGTGWWAYAEPEIPGESCVCCKGTGRQLVSCY